MDKIKELAKDPAALEAKIKEYWGKLDTKGEGCITMDDFRARAAEIATAIGIPQITDEEKKERARKILDPTGSGKVNFEGFKNFIEAGIKKLKEEGKI